MKQQYKLVTPDVNTDPNWLIECIEISKPAYSHRTLTPWVVDHTDRDQIFKDYIGQTGYQIAMHPEDHTVLLFFPLEHPHGRTGRMHGYIRVFAVDELRAPEDQG